MDLPLELFGTPTELPPEAYEELDKVLQGSWSEAEEAEAEALERRTDEWLSTR